MYNNTIVSFDQIRIIELLKQNCGFYLPCSTTYTPKRIF